MSDISQQTVMIKLVCKANAMYSWNLLNEEF